MLIPFFARPSKPLSPADGWAVLVGAAYAAGLLAPVRHYLGDRAQIQRAKIEHDSFPISTYPMFTADRKGRVTVPHVVGFTEKGKRVPLHYSHFGAGGLNQVRKQISRAVRGGDAAKVAQRYADSLAKNPHKMERKVVEVAVVRSRFLFDDYFRKAPGDKASVVNTEPQAEHVHARCSVGGTAEGYKPRGLKPLPPQGGHPA